MKLVTASKHAVRSNKKKFSAVVFFQVALMLILVISLNGCKDFGVPNYSLTVIVGTGVTGTPAAGKYAYKDLSIVAYSYLPIEESQTIEVLVNGSRWATAGNFTMYADIVVEARIMDPRGVWSLSIYPDSTTSDSKITSKITIEGTSLTQGTFLDNRGYHGTWEITKKDGVSGITFTYTDWKDYVLTGGASTMAGTWKGESHGGNWSATRSTTSADYARD